MILSIILRYKKLSMSNSASNPYELNDLTPLTTTIACVLIGIFVLFYLWRRLSGQGKQLVVLLCGPPSSGKTKLFAELAYGKQMDTVTSQMPNVSTCDLKEPGSEGKSVQAQLVDIPGSRQLLARFLPEHVPAATAVVFLMKTFSPVTHTYLASTADCLLQLTEASLLGNGRKNGSIRVLFVVQSEDSVNNKNTIQSAQEQLQAEIDRLTRSNADAIPLGGATAAKVPAIISLAKLARYIDWIVCNNADEDGSVASEVRNWLLN